MTNINWGWGCLYVIKLVYCWRALCVLPCWKSSLYRILSFKGILTVINLLVRVYVVVSNEGSGLRDYHKNNMINLVWAQVKEKGPLARIGRKVGKKLKQTCYCWVAREMAYETAMKKERKMIDPPWPKMRTPSEDERIFIFFHPFKPFSRPPVVYPDGRRALGGTRRTSIIKYVARNGSLRIH